MSYIRFGNTKSLPKEEEIRLCELKNKGCMNARNKLLESVLPYILSIVAKRSKPSDIDDMFQHACIAAMRSIETFDASKGRLTSYITRPVINDIRRYARDSRDIIHIPNYVKESQAVKDGLNTIQKGLAGSGTLVLDTEVLKLLLKIDDDPVNESIRNEQILSLKEAIKRLNKMDQDIINRILNGERQTDIADSYGVERNTLHYFYKRIKKELRCSVEGF